jgi:signal transduction histidine kinase
LLPWKTEDTRGTIFVMAHGRTEAFDENDARLMTMLADFAAMGYRQQKQQARLLEQERAVGAAQMAHTLAHEINNPLQSMTNTAYLLTATSTDHDSGMDSRMVPGMDPTMLGKQLTQDIQRLSGLVNELLSLDFNTIKTAKR